MDSAPLGVAFEHSVGKILCVIYRLFVTLFWRWEYLWMLICHLTVVLFCSGWLVLFVNTPQNPTVIRLFLSRQYSFLWELPFELLELFHDREWDDFISSLWTSTFKPWPEPICLLYVSWWRLSHMSPSKTWWIFLNWVLLNRCFEKKWAFSLLKSQHSPLPVYCDFSKIDSIRHQIVLDDNIGNLSSYNYNQHLFFYSGSTNWTYCSAQMPIPLVFLWLFSLPQSMRSCRKYFMGWVADSLFAWTWTFHVQNHSQTSPVLGVAHGYFIEQYLSLYLCWEAFLPFILSFTLFLLFEPLGVSCCHEFIL